MACIFAHVQCKCEFGMHFAHAFYKMEVGDCAVVRRMIFATSFLSPELPHYWDIIAKFANQDSPTSSAVTPQAAKIRMENLQVLNNEAFITDEVLTRKLINMEYKVTKQNLGIPLVPKEMKCLVCDGKLSLRNDRPSRLTIYTQRLGTVTATHFHKYCHNYHKGCKFVQHYGYHKVACGTIHYNSDCLMLPYFLSSQETGFETAFLKQFDIELLIGQMSYYQKADIYNVTKEYDTTKKKSSTSQMDTEKARLPPAHG